MSTTRVAGTPNDRAGEFDRSVFDLGQLVGRSVSIYSDQYPGRPLAARVVQTDGEYLALERAGINTILDNLVSNQDVTVRFEYKQEQVCTTALLKRRNGGKITVTMGRTVKPLKRRRFVRVPSRQTINLAVLPAGRFQRKKLPHLRWIQTDLVDFSGGGVLFDINNFLLNSTYLFTNIELESHSFPPLVIGAVRHCTQREAGHFHVGLEFIVNEQRSKHFPQPVLQDLPPSALDYSYLKRKIVDGYISAWTQQNNHNRDERHFR